jgi:hypothetical protein
MNLTHKEVKMKARIVEVREQGNGLRIIVEHEYGVDNFGLTCSLKEFNHLTGKPKWIEEVKRLLESKYKNSKPVDQTNFIGTEIDVQI